MIKKRYIALGAIIVLAAAGQFNYPTKEENRIAEEKVNAEKNRLPNSCAYLLYDTFKKGTYPNQKNLPKTETECRAKDIADKARQKERQSECIDNEQMKSVARGEMFSLRAANRTCTLSN